MLTINLATDSLKVVNGHDVIDVTYENLLLPNNRYGYVKGTLKPISSAYDLLRTLTSDQKIIIENLIDIYVPFRYFQVKEYRNMSKVIGFIGHRGSGKTASAVNVLIMDWLIRGEPVWSNIDISIRVCYKDVEVIYSTKPLGALDLFSMDTLKSGAVFVDEINMSAAEGTRYMASANLAFANAMQQIRKRGLNVLWTCQGWNWVDNRTRWQTDWVINCQDAFLVKKCGAQCLGDWSLWSIYELSGLSGTFDIEYETRHRYITDFLAWKGAVWNRPFWNAYDTSRVQGEDSYIRNFKDNEKLENAYHHLELADAREEPARDLAEDAYMQGLDRFYAEDFWKINNITDPGMMRAIGKELNKYFHRRRGTKGYFYERIPANTG